MNLIKREEIKNKLKEELNNLLPHEQIDFFKLTLELLVEEGEQFPDLKDTFSVLTDNILLRTCYNCGLQIESHSECYCRNCAEEMFI